MPPKAPKIMVIRHAEKPFGSLAGVDESGVAGVRDLTVRGWQRAGALACLFAPARGPLQDALLAKPAFIFASAPVDAPETGSARSRRSQETVTPLAQLLGITIDLTFTKGQEKELAKAAQACSGPVLIAWQHENIRYVADSLPGAELTPKIWPSERFDVVFVFTLHPADGLYQFAQVPECLLAGDSADPIV